MTQMISSSARASPRRGSARDEQASNCSMLWASRRWPIKLRTPGGTIGLSVSHLAGPVSVTHRGARTVHQRAGRSWTLQSSNSLKPPSKGGRATQQTAGQQRPGQRPDRPAGPKRFVVDINPQKRHQESSMGRGRKNEPSVLKSGACHLQVRQVLLLSKNFTTPASPEQPACRSLVWGPTVACPVPLSCCSLTSRGELAQIAPALLTPCTVSEPAHQRLHPITLCLSMHGCMF